MAEKSKKGHGDNTAATTTAISEPVFSASALSKLTQRIQQDFSNAKHNEQKTGGKKGKNRRKDGKKDARKVQAQTPTGSSGRPVKPSKAVGYDQHPGKQAPPKAGPSNGKESVAKTAREQTKPAKPHSVLPVAPRSPKNRPPAGKLRPQPGLATNGSPGTSKTVFPKKAGSNKIDKEALLNEIIMLGGTKEDLDLVADIDSDDVEEVFASGKPKGKEKQVKHKDIEAFMREIGLEGAKLGDANDDEMEEDEEEWEDEEQGETSSADGDESSVDGNGNEEDSDVEMGEVAAPTVANSTGGDKKLIFPRRPDWHAEPLPPLTPPAAPPFLNATEKLHDKGKELLKSENEIYSSTHLVKSSDRRFLSQIMQNGTLSDKISALTLVCQESPLHTMKTLETLLGLARKKSRSQAVQALGAIKDLFAQGLVLPPNRKLRYFSKQPGVGAKETKPIHLVAWAYEEWLKNFYFEVLKTLEALCGDQLVYARSNAVGYVYELLKEKPEQEANLLRVLVNKLGDTDKKVASKVSHLLLQLQTAHPAMKSIIINAIESEVVFRPGNSMHAKYYAMITLNQTVLGVREHDVANKLLEIYFALFTSILHKEPAVTVPTPKDRHIKFDNDKLNKKALKRKEKKEKQSRFDEEVNAKLISAVLTGVNRAFPFSKVDDAVLDKHMNTLFRITHSGNFNTGVQALILIHQVSTRKQAVSDRFYRTLYESLMDQRLVNSSKQALYLNLLFKALKSDPYPKRVKAFVKRIIQSATFHQPSFICGVLYLLSELEHTVPSIRSLLTNPEPNDSDEEVFRDVPEEGEEQKQQSTSQENPGPTKTAPKYDGRKRDPLHANAEQSCLWELVPFLNHFHPTVSLFTRNFLEKKPMPSKPDLGMHTLSHFLDRFVYRNPKATPTAHGTSIMQPLAGGTSMGMVLSTRDARKGMAPVNSEQWWKQRVEQVRPEEVFFHKYFNLTKPGEKKSGKRKRKEEDVEDSEAEEEVWEALVNSRPELEGEGSVDFDDDDADLQMSDGDEEDGDESEQGIDLDDREDEWDTDEGSDDEDEDKDADSDAATAFEKQMAMAAAKRQKQTDADSDEDMSSSSEQDSESIGDDREKEEVLAKGEGRGKDEALAKGGISKKRRKLKHLPTFASVEDYAHMLSDSE